MVRYKTGNLLADEAEVLVNTVNTVGVMGKGIALAFKHAFPLNYALYKDQCKSGGLFIGAILSVRETSPVYGTKTIVNFPTKTHWRLPSDYEYIAIGLQKLREWLIETEAKSIAIPPMGCGNGGLDWAQVKPMILNAIGDLDCEINIYEAT